MDFLHPEALDILRQGATEVLANTERLRFDRSNLRVLVRGPHLHDASTRHFSRTW